MASFPITERELPQFIVDQLARETDLSLAYRELEAPIGDARIDGVLELDSKDTLWAEVKRDMRKSQIRNALSHLRHLQTLLPSSDTPKPIVLLTSYLSQAQRDYLRKSHIYYADSAGNAYLKIDGNIILIEGKGRGKIPPISNESFFTPSVMRQAFAYLLKPELIQYPYRLQEDYTEVSKSSIGDNLKKLKQAGYLTVRANDEESPLINLPALAKAWIEAYPKVLKPTLSLTRLKFASHAAYFKWAERWPGNEQLQWGGEPAGALLTGFLSPGAYTLYSRLTTVEVLKTLRAMPDPEGPIEVFKAFWPAKLIQDKDAPQVPPLLAYADLVATQDVRNLQTAQRIHGKYLDHLFAETELGPLPNAF